ncbi:hypothetical protein [Streptomyces sp. NPDC006510]|uniref:hypothetical protein n=1 Tax=Streptomyces sp. NPDC006510 TaxID=3155600 RepID=UPI0033BDD17B
MSTPRPEPSPTVVFAADRYWIRLPPGSGYRIGRLGADAGAAAQILPHARQLWRETQAPHGALRRMPY